jgi:hypothetical protein
MSRTVVSLAQPGGIRRTYSWVIQSTLSRKATGKAAYWKNHQDLTDDRDQGWQDPRGKRKARLPEAQSTVVEARTYGKAFDAHTLLCDDFSIQSLHSPEKWGDD